VLFLRDSFTTLMMPFLGEHFAYATYVYGTPEIHKYTYFEVQARPDYIVEQIVERYLANVPEEGQHY
jgi:hypothetical protein